jgi:hypothetical protein
VWSVLQHVLTVYRPTAELPGTGSMRSLKLVFYYSLGDFICRMTLKCVAVV